MKQHCTHQENGINAKVTDVSSVMSRDYGAFKLSLLYLSNFSNVLQ